MKKSLFVCLLLLVAATTIFGQDISFGYDADGNLESRY
jgi:YD repeat-containing protein